MHREPGERRDFLPPLIGLLLAAGFSASPARAPISDGVNTLEITSRITSYNVCYTKLLRIMDNVADAIVVVDEEGRIETLNRATETTFGIPSRELVGTNVGRLLGPARAPEGPPSYNFV